MLSLKPLGHNKMTHLAVTFNQIKCNINRYGLLIIPLMATHRLVHITPKDFKFQETWCDEVVEAVFVSYFVYLVKMEKSPKYLIDINIGKRKTDFKHVNT